MRQNNDIEPDEEPMPASKDPVIETAAAWYAQLRGDAADGAARAQFQHWLAADLCHRLAYADVCAAALAVEALPPMTEAPPPRRIAASAAPRRVLRAWGAGVFAALLCTVLAWNAGPAWLRLQADTLTAAGEMRTLQLDDGTRVVLGADSALKIRIDAAQREIVLLRGMADFSVAADPTRPFRVHAGPLVATAVGTRYTVQRLPGLAPRVEVEHGEVAVDVEGRRLGVLGAGQRALLAGTDWVVQVQPLGSSTWRDGLLVFENEPLSYVLAALGAWIEDDLRILARDLDAPVTAAIPVESAGAALDALADRHGLRLRALPGSVLLVSRQ